MFSDPTTGVVTAEMPRSSFRGCGLSNRATGMSCADDWPTLSYVVARLDRALRRSINDRVAICGLTTLQYTALSLLRGGRQLSNAQLSRRAYMTPQAMREVIGALADKGLIERNSHPNHRRLFPLGLTLKGRRALQECDAAVADLESQAFGQASEADLQRLRAVLMDAVRALHAGFPEREK